MTLNSAVVTKNKKGFSYSLTSIGNAFIDFASQAEKPVVDIGAAYGIATLPALLHGAKVIAVDIEEKHLQSIEASVDDLLKQRLTTIRGAFPKFDLAPNSVSAVYLSQVLPFLSGKEIEQGARKIFNWLIPGGHVFIVSFTPFISHVSAYIPHYLQQKSLGKPWAGYIENLSMYSNDENIYTNLPNQIMHVDKDDLERTFREAGFVIKEVRYFGEEEGPLPEGIRYDGRERVGMVAFKPMPVSEQRTAWKEVSHEALLEAPEPLRQWLIKPYVLSTALKKVCSNFSVEVKDQCIKYMHTDEVAALGSYDSSLGYVRETCLGQDNSPLVYARVTVPYKTFLAKREELENLGNRPIGESLLYKDQSVIRSNFKIKRISQDDELLFDALVHQNFFRAVIEKKTNVPELWARRSSFHIGEHQLLITEVFLADIPPYVD